MPPDEGGGDAAGKFPSVIYAETGLVGHLRLIENERRWVEHSNIGIATHLKDTFPGIKAKVASRRLGNIIRHGLDGHAALDHRCSVKSDQQRLDARRTRRIVENDRILLRIQRPRRMVSGNELDFSVNQTLL